MGRNCRNITTKPIITSFPYNDITISTEPNEKCTRDPTNKKLYGWICPVCGRGLSPYTNECSCYLTIEYINTDSTINKSNIW